MTLLLDLQSDILGRLLSCSAFDHVGIISLEGNGSKAITTTRDRLEAVLTGVKKTNGKAGLGVLVLMPQIRIESAMQGVPGPQISVSCSLQIIENDAINRSDRGTGTTAESLAYTVLSLLHLFQPSEGVLLIADERAIDIPELDEEMPASVAYQVNFSAPMATTPAAKVPAPSMSYAAGSLTLSGMIGAEHYVTLDGSYPRPGVEASHLYSAAIAVPVGTTARAASYLTDYTGSDVITLLTT